jgi:hypothetical protein
MWIDAVFCWSVSLGALYVLTIVGIVMSKRTRKENEGDAETEEAQERGNQDHAGGR